MSVAPPPARRRSPEHLSGCTTPVATGYAHANHTHRDHAHGDRGHAGYPTARTAHAHASSGADPAGALDDPLSWDHFTVEVTHAQLPVVVRCRGGLDFAYADKLREVLAGITDREVVVDLCRLTFVDSTGLSVLVTARRTLQDVGGTMSIRGACGLVRRVFQAAELADVLDD